MDIKAALTEAYIKRGAILHSYEFEEIDHGKFFVIIGSNEDNLYGFFFINSKINQYLRRKTELYKMQIPLNHEEYSSFLDHNSFLDCHALTTIPKNKLEQQFHNGKVHYKGDLSLKDLNIVMKAVRESDLFSDYDKETFFAD